MLEMKKILLTMMVVSLIILDFVSALSISSCKSDTTEWFCEKNKVCVCEISGDCTNGNLIVYKTNFLSPLCLPEILDNEAEINWDNCQNPIGILYVRASCNEGMSPVKEINISFAPLPTTTTTTSTTSTTSTTISTVPTTTTTVGKNPCPYECCVDEVIYEDKYCNSGYNCVDNKCVKAGGRRGRTIGIIILLIIVIIAVVLYLFRSTLKISF